MLMGKSSRNAGVKRAGGGGSLVERLGEGRRRSVGGCEKRVGCAGWA